MLNKQNKHQSKHSLGHSLIAVGGFLIIFTFTLLSPIANMQSTAIGAKEIIDLSNQSRQQLNHEPLNINPNLMSAAQAKAEDMVKRQYFAHFGPNGESPWDYFKQANYTYTVAGENLAITNEDDAKVIQGWLDSPSHRANMLNDDYRDMGIGIAKFGDYKNHTNTTVIVAFYGQPKAPNEFMGTESTNPAGTITSFQPWSLDSNTLYAIILSAVGIMVLGSILEIRHIRGSHHIHSHMRTA